MLVLVTNCKFFAAYLSQDSSYHNIYLHREIRKADICNSYWWSKMLSLRSFSSCCPIVVQVDRERSLVNSKVIEFENLCKSPRVPQNLASANQNSIPRSGPNAFSQNAPSSAPTVSSFCQLGTSLNIGVGSR